MKKMPEKAGMRVEANHIHLDGVITKETIPQLWDAAAATTEYGKVETIDLKEVEAIDSAGVMFIEELAARVKSGNSSLADKPLADLISNYSDTIKHSLSIFSTEKLGEFHPIKKPGFFEGLGNGVIDFGVNFFDALVLAADIFYWSIVGLWKKKGSRKGTFTQQCILIGVDAVPIILLLSFIIGLILALQSAVQLRMFGANIFIADLITVAMLREMGPMMTAIIIAGRSGSAIASEIATMKVSEELDALKMMAMNPIRYVVVPKFYAITICMPLLATISIIIGIVGGIIIGVVYLNLSVTAFYNQMLNVLELKDLLISLLKSTIFAWAIVIIGSYYGFRVEGGAEGVGKATTMSVVASIFAVIVIDVIFSLLYLPR